MDVVLDSVSFNHLTRGPRGKDVMTPLVVQRRVRITLDRQRAIADEWLRTSSPEVVKMLMARWSEAGGLVVLRRDGRLPQVLKKRLREAGFRDGIDKVIVQTALVTTDRVVISEDSDFWDPLIQGKKGHANAAVARLLREEEGILVFTLGEFVAKLTQR